MPLFVLANEHNISLENHALALNDFNFYVADVVDALTDKHCIGFVQKKGLENTKIPAMLGESIESEFRALLTKSFPKDGNKIPLTIRINKILIYELVYSGGYKYAFSEINITFLHRQEDYFIELFDIGASVNKSNDIKGVGDVTEYHPDNILRVLEFCFRQFKDAANKTKLSSTKISLSELTNNPLNKQNYPIHAATEYPKGIYHNFADFRNNLPDPSYPFKVKYKRKKREAKIIWADGSTASNGIWGFSDGKTIYINIDGAFHALWKEGRDFKVTAPSLQRSNPVYFGGAIGGIVGAIIMSQLDFPEGIDEEYEIDFSTGSIASTNVLNFKKVEARSLIYFSSFEKENMQLTLRVNGKYQCKLTAGTYNIIRTIPSLKQIEICLTSSNGEKYCEEINPVPFKTTVFICRTKRKGNLVLETPSMNTQETIAKKIKEGKIVEACMDN